MPANITKIGAGSEAMSRKPTEGSLDNGAELATTIRTSARPRSTSSGASRDATPSPAASDDITVSSYLPDYHAFADRLTRSGLITDPWINGRARFRPRPVVLSVVEANELAQAAEDVARLWDEACRLCAADSALLDRVLRLTPVQQLLWSTSAPRWHGIARADLFRLRDGGIAVSELNCDTPSGQPEAIVLGGLCAGDGLFDPSARLVDRLVDLFEELARRASLTIGIVYPTQMTEDLSMIELFRRSFEARGHRVVLGSPFNLRVAPARRVALLGVPCDAILRHYKADWWGERTVVWSRSAPFSDAAPLGEPLVALLDAVLEGNCVLVNPWGAIVPQNKRLMALMWEHAARFSPWGQDTIRRLVPETRCLEHMGVRRREDEREQWVLKSDYGCESDEVVIGRSATPEVWRKCLEEALPGRWVAQRRFDAVGDESGVIVNHGVFLVAGRSAGMYCRIEPDEPGEPVRSAGAVIRTTGQEPR